MRQNTIAATVTWTGIGVHSGRHVTMTARPAPADHGVRFVRVDLLNGARVFHALYDRVAGTDHCTVLGNGSGEILSTVEHFMAALSLCGIDNLEVEVDGCELPIMDGSSAEFVEGLARAGLLPLDAPRECVRVLKEVEVRHGRGWARLRPSGSRVVHCRIAFPGTLIGRQEASIDLGSEGAESPIVMARTFATLDDVKRLQDAGLVKGGSTKNAIVVDRDRVLNEEGLRSPTECAEHKVLDAVGDLALAPLPVLGDFEGYLSGHTHNNLLLRKLFADTGAWRREKAGEA